MTNSEIGGENWSNNLPEGAAKVGDKIADKLTTDVYDLAIARWRAVSAMFDRGHLTIGPRDRSHEEFP